MREIHDGVADVIRSLGPEAMALEKLYAHYDRPTTAILMGHARGVIVLAAAEAGVPVHDYASTQVKKTLTGAGRAPKSQMQEAIRRELRLTKTPDPPDVADALAIALCHAWSSAGALRSADSASRLTSFYSRDSPVSRDAKVRRRGTRPPTPCPTSRPMLRLSLASHLSPLAPR